MKFVGTLEQMINMAMNTKIAIKKEEPYVNNNNE
jgi:hypothetical protein